MAMGIGIGRGEGMAMAIGRCASCQRFVCAAVLALTLSAEGSRCRLSACQLMLFWLQGTHLHSPRKVWCLSAGHSVQGSAADAIAATFPAGSKRARRISPTSSTQGGRWGWSLPTCT